MNTQFKLSRQPDAPGKPGARFHVLDSAGDTCGIITVPHAAAAELEKCWQGGATTQPKAALATGPPRRQPPRPRGQRDAARGRKEQAYPEINPPRLLTA